MATEAQVVANRLNARKSTGPRTAEGKATAAQNAVKHGLRAQHVVIRGEDPGEFEFYREQVLSELAPSGAMESILAERVVGLAWRLRRAERIQAEVFDAMLIKDETSPVAKLVRSMQSKEANDGATALGTVVVKDFANSRVLDRLGMYERRIEHSLYRTVAELQKLRLLRQLEEGTPTARRVVKAGDPDDEPARSKGDHRPAALDAATQAKQTDYEPFRQTKPISAFSGSKTGFERECEAKRTESDRSDWGRGTRDRADARQTECCRADSGSGRPVQSTLERGKG